MPTLRQSLPLLLFVALVTAVAFISPSTMSGQGAIDESFQPIVVASAALTPVLNTPINELFVYVFRDGTWAQIPQQIDEKTLNAEGKRVYTAEGDGRLDADEELVFMLKDMGQQAPPSAWVDGADTDHRIELAVETSEGSRHWAYLFHGAGLSRTFAATFSGVARHRPQGQAPAGAATAPAHRAFLRAGSTSYRGALPGWLSR